LGFPGLRDTARVSQENVEQVQKICEAFTAGDFERALSGLHDAVVWHGTVGGLDEGRVARGRREVIDAFAENLQEWESHILQARRFIDAGDRVVVFWHEEGRGLSSGAEVKTDTAVIYTLRDGRIVDVQGFMDRALALDAVGLVE
jgi:ketosteroid isomerase-like protein